MKAAAVGDPNGGLGLTLDVMRKRGRTAPPRAYFAFDRM
jgi:hypothetical protein